MTNRETIERIRAARKYLEPLVASNKKSGGSANEILNELVKVQAYSEENVDTNNNTDHR